MTLCVFGALCLVPPRLVNYCYLGFNPAASIPPVREWPPRETRGLRRAGTQAFGCFVEDKMPEKKAHLMMKRENKLAPAYRRSGSTYRKITVRCAQNGVVIYNFCLSPSRRISAKATLPCCRRKWIMLVWVFRFDCSGAKSPKERPHFLRWRFFSGVSSRTRTINTAHPRLDRPRFKFDG